MAQIVSESSFEHAEANTPKGPKLATWNDATLSGGGGSKWNALLKTTVHATYGRQYSDKKKQRQKGTPDDQWNGVPGTWGQFIEGSAGEKGFFSTQRRDTTGFSRHEKHADKEGGSCVFGNCLGNHTNVAVDSNCAIGLDHDTGHVTYEEANRRVADSGIAAIIYTTHSHLKTESEFKRDAVVKFARCSGEPSIKNVKSYAAEKKGLAPHIIESLQIEDTYRTGDGTQILVSHAPIDKFRVIIPFAEGDVRIGDMGNTDSDAHALYARKVYGVAGKLGIPTDPATTNVARLFYLPRHPAGAEHGITIHQEPPISFWDIPEAEAGMADTGPRSGQKYKRRPDMVAEDGTDVSDLYDRYAKRWMLAEICETAGLETSAQVSNSGGKFHVRCPFADGHTDSRDDSATFAMNAEDSQTEFAVVDCCHGSCQSANAGEKRHAVDYLGAWIDSGELDPELLQDPAFMIPFGSGQPDEKFFRRTPDEIEESVGVDEEGSGDGEFEDPDDYLPAPYVRGKDMMFYQTTNDEDDTVNIPVCGPIDLRGRTMNEEGTGEAGRAVSFKSESGKRVEMTISRAELYAHPKIVWEKLADAGLPLAGRDKKAEDRVLNLFAEMTPQRQIINLQTPGMIRVGDGQIVGFMLPTGQAMMRGKGEYRLHEDSTIPDTRYKGTCEGWQAAANAAMSHVEENPYWTLAACSAFAGPLLGILDWNPLGFNFSGPTSKGKSLGEVLCSAVWGNPADGKGTFWGANSTPNGWEDLAVFGSGTSLCVDELGAMQDKRTLAPLMFALHSGRGKVRKRGNGAGLTKLAEFRPFVLFSSESSIKAEVEAAGVPYRGGMAVRFPDVDVSEGMDRTPEELAKIEACKKNYGLAGPLFIQYLFDAGICDDPLKLEKELEVIVAQLADGKTPGLRRAARPFALAQRAGELAVDAGLLDDVEAVRKGVKICWETFLKSDEAATANGSESLMDGFVSWANSQMDVTIISATGIPGYEPSNSEGRGRVIGWYTDEQIIFDWKALEAMDIPNTYGKRSALTTALGEIGALDRGGASNIPYTSLPTEVGALPGGGDKRLKNMRVWRKKLGI